MELNCRASAFGQNGLTFENPDPKKLGFPLEMHPYIEKFPEVLAWTWSWLTYLSCSPLHCFARKNIRAASQFEHCSAQLQQECGRSVSCSPSWVPQWFNTFTCLFIFLYLPPNTQEIHLIFLIFSVPAIHSQSSRSSWIIHWNHYH